MSILTSAIVAALVASLVLVPTLLTGEDDDSATETEETGETGETDGTEAEAPSLDLSELEDVDSPVEAIAESTLSSVARVDVPGGAGSAVVYDSDGLLLTNNHVVANADEVRVVLADGERVPAEIVGQAAFADLAVLRVDVDGLQAAEFADELPRVGELAVAIGSPFGLDATVTSGVVSALERSIVAGMGPNSQPLGDLIQTDAAINPGNSGGPLVDSTGEVIGINTAIASGTGANQGVGFAIPSINAVPIAERLIEEGTIAPAFLGIEGEDVDPQDSEMFDLGVARGAIIRSVVPNTPADEAGLAEGDVIVAVDGRPIDTMVALAARIRVLEPGTEVEIEYVREGETRTTELELVETPEDLPTSG
ncbi:MAG: S1C family serine protease [Actinomycetota bacterium]